MDSQVYQRAESFLPWNLQHAIYNTTIFPYWTSKALYYFQESDKGKYLIAINIQTGKKVNLLDFKEIVRALEFLFKKDINPDKLPLNKFSIKENPLQLYFLYEKYNCYYDIENNVCIKEEDIKLGYLKSPDEKWLLYLKNYNLVLKNIKKSEDFFLTLDGESYYDYASSPETNTRAVTERLSRIPKTPVALWSSDSTKIVTHKLDQRKVSELFILQNAPEKSNRPNLHSYRMSFSGDADLPLAELIIIDILNKKIIPLKVEACLSPYLTPIELKWVWWSEDCKKIYFLKETRGSKELTLFVADAGTGQAEALITEKAETYVEPSCLAPWPPQVIILEKEKKIIWLSQRSGYPHLYLHDIRTKNEVKITYGDWYIREVHFYDAKNDWLYFTACGYNKNIDPYYKQLYRCHINGSDLECLTKENAHHSIFIAPSKSHFLDTYSTIDTAPITVLKKINGEILCCVEKSDINHLFHLNWIAPKRICLKARDGRTNIYGNLYFPSTFDPNKKYPIIDHIYPGPQIYRTSPYFSLYSSIFRSTWTAQALAELGFIVLHLDGLGTPGRSKSFHDATYANIGDCGIPDHVEAIKQLAAENDFIDLEKVGITGYSGGGYAAARAMLMYPDFFKVGVSAGGNHDLRCYPASYGEKYNSLNFETYASQSNAIFAEKLEGKLLLIHGEMDDNVHPCATMQFVNALINYNKDFDMLIMPNQNHSSTFDHPYYWRRHWDYFVQHLLGETPPKNYYIKSIMPFEFPQVMDW